MAEDRPQAVPVCVATKHVLATLIISQNGSPDRFRPLLRVNCPYCSRSHIHGAGTDATAYWRVPHCRNAGERTCYVLRVRPVDRWLIFAWLTQNIYDDMWVAA